MGLALHSWRRPGGGARLWRFVRPAGGLPGRRSPTALAGCESRLPLPPAAPPQSAAGERPRPAYGVVTALVWIVGLLVLVGSVGAEEWGVDQWEQTVYYRYTFNVPDTTGAMLRVTAVDEYEVFLNGEVVGGDTDWTTVDEYAVQLQRRNNNLAVRVDNGGQGNGSGLLVEVDAGGQVWTSTSGALQELWYWSGEEQEGDGWLTANVSRSDAWTAVQRGRLERGALTGWADTLGSEVIAGYPGGVDAGLGGLTLRTVAGENLAFRLPSNRPEVFDGRPNTGWVVDPTELNALAEIDLLQLRRIGEVRVLTQGRNADEMAQNTLRGYAVQVSNDRFRWNEVGVLHGIDQFERTSVIFEPLVARYLQVVIAEVNAVQRARVAEIQVLGDGVAPSGAFVSAPLDLGSDQRKVFSAVRWSGEVPDVTELTLRFRSSDDGVAWSDWSAGQRTSPALLQVPEPRALLQYRVDLSSNSEDVAPRLDSLVIDFTDQVPVSLAQSWVSPNQVVLGRDTNFVYRLELDFADFDLGVERLRLATPSRVELQEVLLPDGVQVAETLVLGDAVELTFAEPWRQAGAAELRFSGRLLSPAFDFRAQLYAGATALDADQSEEIDVNSGEPRSWRVRASDAVGPLLSQVRLVPPAFSPNGDGVNDDTAVEFTLARVSEPQAVEVGIFDVSGRRLRILDAGELAAGQYLDTAANPARWDGRDSAGELVPPGIYLVRLRLRLEREEVVRLRTVAVVY